MGNFQVFGKGFNLYKKQIRSLHPKLDIQDLEIDDELDQEEEEEEEYESKDEEKGEKEGSQSPLSS